MAVLDPTELAANAVVQAMKDALAPVIERVSPGWTLQNFVIQSHQDFMRDQDRADLHLLIVRDRIDRYKPMPFNVRQHLGIDPDMDLGARMLIEDMGENLSRAEKIEGATEGLTKLRSMIETDDRVPMYVRIAINDVLEELE